VAAGAVTGAAVAAAFTGMMQVLPDSVPPGGHFHVTDETQVLPPTKAWPEGHVYVGDPVHVLELPMAWLLAGHDTRVMIGPFGPLGSVQVPRSGAVEPAAQVPGATHWSPLGVRPAVQSRMAGRSHTPDDEL
jgi:hypothetical protein